MRDLQRLPDPFQRIGLLHILQRITAVRLLQLFTQHRRRHIARADTVDPYPRRQIQGQRFRKRYDSALGRAVQRTAIIAIDPRVGSNVHDARPL